MGRLLLADGETRALERWERALTQRGHEVEIYAEGHAALEALREIDRHFDLVVWELRLQDVGGLELLEALREIRPSLPVVLSGDCWMKQECEAALAAGARRLVTRPLSIEVLCEIGRELGVPDGSPPERRPDLEAANTMSLRQAPSGAFSASEARDRVPTRQAPRVELEPEAVPEPVPEPSQSDPVEDLAPPHVLVVERDACARRLLSYCLDRQAIRVAESSSRIEACELAEMDTPDAIILGSGDGDLSLADTLMRLRTDRTLEAVPVIALYESGYTTDAVLALDLGADVALETPYEPDVLFGHIRAAIRRVVRVRRLAVEAARHHARLARRPATDRRAAGAPRVEPRTAHPVRSAKESVR